MTKQTQKKPKSLYMTLSYIIFVCFLIAHKQNKRFDGGPGVEYITS